ncbi:MAG: dTDP-4-dehydrorhamnose reductase [Pseudomonadota bacterium]|nr:dTDP-4-dehydrorhamnose reductase [Pseudomonadota bacterium]
MKILLLGGNGQVGHELRRSLAPLGDVVVTTRDGRLADGASCEALDLSELDGIAPLVERTTPDVVVNAAAYTAVDRAEDEAEAAFRANAEAPARLSAACAAAGADLVHYSTDYVFDGTGTRPYREDDPTSPLGVYGASKLAGEQAIRASGARHLILRTAWVYGLHGQNFLRTMLRVGAQRDELRVVSDQIGSPTPAWLIADVTAAVLSKGLPESAVRHLVTGGETTWYGFATAIFEQAAATGRMPRHPRVVPITTAEYPTRATRPAYSVLDTTCLREAYGVKLMDWRAALDATFDDVRHA